MPVVVKPEQLPPIEKLRALDPQNIVKPEYYFNSEAEAVGLVFSNRANVRAYLPVNDESLASTIMVVSKAL